MIISEQDTLVINQVFKDFDRFLKTGKQDNYNFTNCHGLCSNIFDTIEDELTNHELSLNLCEISYKLFKSWEHFTGCYSYPIPFRLELNQDEDTLVKVLKSDEITYEEVAYSAAYDLYDIETDYGLLRRDLYQHIKDNIFNVIAEI